MLKIYLPIGIAACGKSTWAKEEVRKDPEGTTRINRDDLRNMMSNYHFTDKNEKLVTDVAHATLKFALKRNRNVIMDETNLNPRNFEEICKIARESGKDCMVIEKPFFVEKEEALARNAKREGTARIPDDVIEKMWRKSGGNGHKHYKAKVEVINGHSAENNWKPLEQDESKDKAIICDLDGSICNLSHRSPYDTEKCINDEPIQYVIDLVKLFHSNGYKVIFCSGREDKFRNLTEQWLNTYVGIEHQLFMRPSGDFRKDNLIKEEIFNSFIRNKYNIKAVIDDRLQVCRYWFDTGLPLFRVGDPESSF